MKKIKIIFFVAGLFIINNSIYAYNPIETTPIANENNFSNVPSIGSSDFNKTDINLTSLKNDTPVIPKNSVSDGYNKTVPKTPPAPNYSTMFPTSKDVENNESTPLVGNDGLPTKDINGSTTYFNNMGTIRVVKKVDANGRVYYVDASTGKVVNINSYKISNDYKKAKDEYYEALYKLEKLKTQSAEDTTKLEEINKEIGNTNNSTEKKNLTEEKEQIEKEINTLTTQINNQEINVSQSLTNYKNEKFKEMDRAGYNAITIYNSSGQVRKEAVAKGASLVNNKFNSKSYKDYNVSSTKNTFVQKIVKESQKMNSLYNETYGVNIDKMSKNSPVIADKNVTNIINAYKAVDEITQQAKNRLSNNYIKCYVSRELIPAYYCPLSGLDSNTYPDYSHVTSIDELEQAVNTGPDDAKKTCNSICHKKYSCLNYNILNSIDINTSSETNYTIYPRKYYDKPYEIDIPTDKRMAIDNVSLYIKINPNLNEYNKSEHDNMSFEEYYKSLGKSLKIKMDAYAYYKDKPAVPLARNMLIEIKGGTFVKVNLNPNMPMDKLILYFKKPYLYNSQFLELNDEKAQNLLKKYIKSVVVYDLKGTYESKDLWFCPFTQIVNNQNECKTPILELKNGTSILRICTDADHKIGPDNITGGFYTNESCMNSCIQKEECKPTYRQYKYITNFLGGMNGVYKIKVGCVDSPDNTNCADKECEALFKDSSYRPNDEIVIQGDDTKVYTVRNKQLTGVLRPRIDLADELNATTNKNITNVFIKEMKDAAYQNMVNEQNYNVIKYPVGTESPRQQAYKLTTYSLGHQSLSVMLKPDSFLYDDGNNYYLYSIIKIGSIYRPEYGVFLLGANTMPSGETTVDGESGNFSHTSYYVDATKHPLVLKDIMYAIKDPSSPNGWKVFREQYFNQIRITKLIKVCYDANGNQTESDYNPSESFTACTEDQVVTTINDKETKTPRNCCFVTTKTRWVDYAGSHVDRNAFYDKNNDTFLVYDVNSQLAPYYKEIQFTSDQPIYTFDILKDLINTPHEIPGLLFHSQKEKDNGQSFRRVFQGGWEPKYNALLGNIEVFNFYADHKLTYSEVLNELTKKNKIFDLYNESLYQQKIVPDGKFDNNIVVYKLGKPDKLSVQANIKPKIDEENKKAFKFVFLKDFIESLTPITVDNIKKSNNNQ